MALPGEYCMIRTKTSNGHPLRVKVFAVHPQTGNVLWVSGDNTEQGKFPIDQWDAVRGVQVLVAENPGLVLPEMANPSTLADRCITLSRQLEDAQDALKRIGQLTEIVSRVEAMQEQLGTNILIQAGFALRKIKEECEAALAQTFETLPT